MATSTESSTVGSRRVTRIPVTPCNHWRARQDSEPFAPSRNGEVRRFPTDGQRATNALRALVRARQDSNLRPQA